MKKTNKNSHIIGKIKQKLPNLHRKIFDIIEYTKNFARRKVLPSELINYPEFVDKITISMC